MIPFDLSRMDGSGCGYKTVDRVFEVAKLYIGVNDKCQDGAAILLARWVGRGCGKGCGLHCVLRLVTRKDVKALKLEEYLSWVLEVMDNADSML